MLPETLPAHFQATYTPIAAAGTEGQIKHMARLLSTQLSTAGMGKGIADQAMQVCITILYHYGDSGGNIDAIISFLYSIYVLGCLNLVGLSQDYNSFNGKQQKKILFVFISNLPGHFVCLHNKKINVCTNIRGPHNKANIKTQ